MRRIDLSGNRLISYDEFCEAVTPTRFEINAHHFRRPI